MTMNNWLAYKQNRNRCTSAVRNAKCLFFIQSAGSDSKNFWRQVKLCTDMGKLNNSQLPWPCSTQAISKTSANA